MDPLQILERYFSTFIGQDDPKAFFVGLTDYLDYGDAVPEFDVITSQISLMPKGLMDKYATQQEVALKKIRALHKEISSYVSDESIENATIKNALKEYGDFEEKRAFSSSPLPYTLYDELHDVLEVLYGLPEHKDFASKYVELSPTNNTIVRQYLPIQELDDFLETKKELERGSEDALWGAQMRLYELRDVVRKGRETHKQIVERHKKREAGATFDLLNFSVIMGEWSKIEEDRAERDPVFFNPKKVRPKAQRFHMYVVAHFAEAQKALAGPGKISTALSFDADKSRLYVHGHEVAIRKFSDQYHALRIIFEKPEDVPQEWFFSEIAERVDEKKPGDKRYYNAVYQIREKLAKEGFPEFFITTKQSAKINSKYLS